MLRYFKSIFDGTLDSRPGRLTLVQSVIVTVLAILMSAALYLTVGVHFPGVGYQVFAALVIASILAPIFLYPTFRTASRLRQAYAVIRSQAYTDHLTKLPNSFALTEELDARVARGDGKTGIAVHFLDLNRFKQVNDGLGHDAGDALLVAVAETLRRTLAPGGFVARFGGDQFVVLQAEVSTPADAADFARKLLDAVSRQYDIFGHEVIVSASAGTALAPLHGTEARQLVKAADLALYKAKAAGASWSLFETALATAATYRRDIEVGLRGALENHQLELVYQPIVRADNTLRIVAFEALMRWRTANGTWVLPDDFIPVAESTGMIVDMGQWALRQACRECVSWHSDIRVAVNVSPVQFLQGNFLDVVSIALAESGLAPDRLELEITESVLIADTSHVEPILMRLRQMGVRIALDDFGSGFCGLNYLRRFMIDKIKVDKSIVSEAASSEKAANILRGVAKIAAEIGMTVTIEGVDTIEKADLINREKCADELQGFLYSRPVQASVVPKMLRFLGDKTDQPSNVVNMNGFFAKRSNR